MNERTTESKVIFSMLTSFANILRYVPSEELYEIIIESRTSSIFKVSINIYIYHALGIIILSINLFNTHKNLMRYSNDPHLKHKEIEIH